MTVKKESKETKVEESQAEEKALKKSPDYSSTAINLKNPPAVLVALEHLHECSAIADDIKGRIAALNPTLQAEFLTACSNATDALQALKSLIGEQGSYQDLVLGHYALQFERTYLSYDVEKFKAAFPKLVPLVVEETVNIQALKGQLKAKTLTEESLKEANCVIEDIKPQYYVR